MSFIKKLFGLKIKTTPDVVPDKTVVERCPACNSQKVTVQFSKKDLDGNEAQPSKQVGSCVIIESGSLKRICQECKHVWGEENFDSPAYLMMKPKKSE